jgi:hypothetical protein
MTEIEAARWFNAAPKEAVLYVRTTAAAYLAQRGALSEAVEYAAAGRDAFCMACTLAAKFWPPEPVR